VDAASASGLDGTIELKCGYERLALVGVGTFFAQATATRFVGHAATAGRGSASGIYLTRYFLGRLVGIAILGQLYRRFG
jgi:hypothetical protein